MKWIRVRLIDISNPKQWKQLSTSELTETGYNVYGANGIIGRYTEYNHELPTLAITCRGASCGSLNITKPKSYITGNAMALDSLNSSVDMKFLYYALKKRGFNDIISGSAQPQITREGLSKVTVEIPEKLEDQIRIATILSKTEALIKQRNESIDLLDEYLRSTFLEMFGDPVKNERNWNKGHVGKYTDCIVPGRDKPKSFTGTIPWFTTADLIHKGFVIKSKNNLGLSDFEIKEVKAKRIPFGSVIMTCVGDLGVVSINKEVCIVNQQLHAFLCKPQINNIFLMFNLSFMTSYMYKMASTTTVPYMNKTICNSIPVILPDINLQTRFANIVEKTESLKAQYQSSLAELENLYGSLSQKAFKGELNLSFLQVLVPEEEYQSFTNDRTEPHHFERNIDLDTITIKIKPHQFSGGVEPLVAGEGLANLIKKKYKNKHFSFEMLVNFIKREKAFDLDKYFSSEEIKGNPKYDETEDLKVFLETAIVNVEMDLKQKGKVNPWLKLNQHFYNAKTENISLTLTKEDLELVKERKLEERSGIYFNIVS